jgi:hypothetical protein
VQAQLAPVMLLKCTRSRAPRFVYVSVLHCRDPFWFVVATAVTVSPAVAICRRIVPRQQDALS